MKKLLMLLLSAVMCVQLTACSFMEDTKWVDEGAALMGTELTSNQFVLDGKLYTFPMDMQEWLDNGWHISRNYDNVKEFELEPGEASSEFELFNDNEQYVEVCAYNYGDESATVDKCMVCELSIDVNEFNVVFPGGVYSKTSAEDIFAAYGEPDVNEASDREMDATYIYDTEDDWGCTVTLKGTTEKVNEPFTEIEYVMTAVPEWTRFYRNAAGEEGCARYIDATLNASLYGDGADYVKYDFGTAEDAEENYASQIDYFTSSIIYFAGINEENLDEETIAAYDELAKQALAKASWEVTKVSLNEDELTGTVEIAVYPINLLDMIDEEYATMVAKYQARYGGENLDEATIDLNFAKIILEVMNERLADLSTKEAVTLSYDIDYDEWLLYSEDWWEIIDVAMDVVE